jgi:hypothetical protein
MDDQNELLAAMEAMKPLVESLGADKVKRIARSWRRQSNPRVLRSDNTDARSGFEHEAGARYVLDGAVAALAEPEDTQLRDLQPAPGVRKVVHLRALA